MEYVVLGGGIDDGLLAWLSFGINVTLAREMVAAATLYEDGGVQNQQGGFPQLPPGFTFPPGGFPTGGLPPGFSFPPGGPGFPTGGLPTASPLPTWGFPTAAPLPTPTGIGGLERDADGVEV